MMRRTKLAHAIAVLALSGSAALAQSGGVEKLYVLNCGEGIAGDISRWTPGLNEGKTMDFVDSCYLIKHAKGWFLWDTGIADAVAAMPNGLVPADPKAVTWRRPKTLQAQLEQLGVKLFPQSVLYVQKAEYDWPGANNTPRFKPSHPVELLTGDKDVFGDGSVTILSTPGHTPGHQSLLVKLQKTGAVVLSGDAVHFKDTWDNRRVPGMNVDKDQTTASMQKIADTLAKEKAQLWINHDKAQRDSQKLAPEFYD